jgi:cation diffusion facilitator CzcD-associated flavoprotein CzcO
VSVDPHSCPLQWISEYPGQLLHSADYRNPEPFIEESVLVVGSGCSGMEIAYDLPSAEPSDGLEPSTSS